MVPMCDNPWVAVYVCVWAAPTSTIYNTTTAASQDWPAWTPAPTPTDVSPADPAPTQSGLADGCRSFYLAKQVSLSPPLLPIPRKS